MIIKELAVGDTAKIIGFLETKSPYRKKLLAMGMVPGTEITVVRIAPLGDPIEVLVRGSSLILRKSEAEILQLERVSE